MDERPKTGILISFVMLVCLVQSTAALSFPDLPGLTALTMSSTSGSDVSSSLSISSSTNIVSSGPSPGSSSAQQQNTQGIEATPKQWKPGVREGIFYDPSSKTSWVYDRILRKYYSPDKGWILIGQYSKTNPPKLMKQFYYDPKNVVFIDMLTGQTINIDQTASYENPSGTVVPTLTPTPKPTSSSTVIMMSPGVSPTTQGEQTNDPCLVPCAECPGGSCKDCDHNGICDDGESNQAGQSSAGGISEAPQTEILPMMIEIPGCTFLSCPTCFGKVCYDCDGDEICDDPQPSPTGSGI